MHRDARVLRTLSILLWWAILGIAAVGCATTEPSRPTPDIDATVETRLGTAVASSGDSSLLSTLTPNIDATVEALVNATLAELPVSTPVPVPTPVPTPNIDATVEARLQAALVAAATTSAPTPDVESTVEARVKATVAAIPEATPTQTPAKPSATPQPTATPKPIPIQEAVPLTPIPPTVYGVLEVSFEPRGSDAVVPAPPIDAAFVIESVDGEERVHWIDGQDTGPSSFDKKATILNFGLALKPGDYRFVGLVGQHIELGDDPIAFPPFRVGFGTATLRISGYIIATLEFTVPKTGCIHVGKISATYFRASPGSRAEQDRVFDQIIREIKDGINVVYLRSGSLVAKSAQHQIMYHDEWIDEAITRDCQITRPKWITE